MFAAAVAVSHDLADRITLLHTVRGTWMPEGVRDLSPRASERKIGCPPAVREPASGNT